MSTKDQDKNINKPHEELEERPRQAEGNSITPFQFTDNAQVQQRVSIAIDFGTSNCAVAYSAHLKKEDIFVNNEWNDGEKHCKIPTAALFNDNEELVAFGTLAVKKYCELKEEEEDEIFYFFQNFKMELYDEKKISNQMVLHDTSGKTMNASKIFSSVFKFLRDVILNEIKKQGIRELSEHEIVWVITVPAIWSNKAKQFMREAAVKAGCINRNILIALEPEVASIYCQNQPNNALQELLKKGSKYLVVDIGGGTVDVTAHEYEKKDSLKEIYCVSGGDMGGLKVDQLFEDLLEKMFSKENIQHIKNEANGEWMKMHRKFEKGKKMVVEETIENAISIGASKQCPWNRNYFTNLPINKTKGVELKINGRLKISTLIIKEMIRKVAISITNHIAGIFKEIDIKSLDAIIMVGGFSNSQIVLEEMNKLVNSEVPIIVPGNAELSVVMGAVLFGWKSNIIRVRKSRITYGISLSKLFIEGFHDNNRSYINEIGTKHCSGCFEKLVTINQDIEVNQHIELVRIHPYMVEAYTPIIILTTTDENPKYDDDEGVQEIGEIRIPSPEECWGKKIIMNFYFGETELKVKVFDETSGETYEKEVDFMFNNCVNFKE